MSETRAYQQGISTEQNKNARLYIVVMLTQLSGFHIMYGSNRKWK